MEQDSHRFEVGLNDLNFDLFCEIRTLTELIGLDLVDGACIDFYGGGGMWLDVVF